MEHALKTVNARMVVGKLYSHGREGLKRRSTKVFARVILSACTLMGFSAFAQKVEGLKFHSQVDTALNAPRIGARLGVEILEGVGVFAEGDFVLSDQESQRHPGYFLSGGEWNLEIFPDYSVRLSAAGAKRFNQWLWPIGIQASARFLNWDFQMASRIWLAAEEKTQDFQFAVEREFLKNSSRSYSAGVRWSLFAQEQLEFIEIWSCFFGVKF